ncbi:MAG: hypothetical protein L0Y44_02230 [Phycisphaerales bacterium]|nr:hypothetical protein [Phycisphaerales bacterium]MCI0629453.1 hypothetical protein [Phycisphaerales bacterium]MCI0674962.1 hypothetical protein [Phycisphaerales bacterium]
MRFHAPILSAPHSALSTFQRSRAFTLTEVLVTLGAIVLLVGLLAPALSSVGASSRSLRCQTNLRQICIGAQNYAAIYQLYPPAIRYDTVGGVWRNIAWDWVTTFSNQVVSPGALWAFTDNPGEVQQCPDCSDKSSYGEPFTGYNYNTTYIGGEGAYMTTGWEYFRKGVPPHACARSSQCAMFGDGGYKDGPNKYMRAPIDGAGQPPDVVYSGGQAFRHHAKTTNIAFVDCHTGSSRTPHKGNLATPNLLSQMNYPRNGFLSDDDSAYDPR